MLLLAPHPIEASTPHNSQWLGSVLRPCYTLSSIMIVACACMPDTGSLVGDPWGASKMSQPC